MKNNRRNRKNGLSRQWLAMLLVAVMLVGYLLPGGAAATEDPTEGTTAPVETVPETTGSADETVPETTGAAATEPEATTVPTKPEETVPETTAPAQTQPTLNSGAPTVPQQTAYEKAMADLAAMEEEAKTLEPTLDVLNAFFFDRLMAAWDAAQLMWEKDQISDDEMTAINEKAQSIVNYLHDEYGYENGVINTEEETATGPVRTTVRGAAENVKFNLFNYDARIDNYSGAGGAVLRFKAQLDDSGYYNRDVYYTTTNVPTGDYHYDIVNSDGYGTVATPEMKLNLTDDGYPNVANAGGKAGSLKYLFDTNVFEGKQYYPVYNDGSGTGLFQRDRNGSYYYKSALNHAEYVNGKLQLYNFALRPFGGRLDNRGQGHFLPFNTETDQAKQITDENGKWVRETNAEKVTEEDIAFWKSVNLWDATNNSFAYDLSRLANNATLAPNVWVLGNEYDGSTEEKKAESLANLPDYWYGFTVEFDFNVTMVNDEGRPVIVDSNGNVHDMIFSFLGDDDVFVYIDDVLLLDLGGGSCDYGEINFTKGTSYEKGGSSSSVPSGSTNDEYTRNITEIFNAALNEAGKTQNYNYDNEFRKYSTHTLKFFYLERGTGTANNQIVFNMEPMPAGTIQVIKELDENSTVTAVTADDEYTFELEEQTATDTWVPVKQAEYVIGSIEGKTDNNGCFKLKQGQMAAFTTLAAQTDAGRVFRVREVDDGENATVLKAEYSDNKEGNTDPGKAVNNGSKYTEFTIKPADQDNGIVHTSKFTNVLKSTDFTVSKKVTGNMGDWSNEFDFTAELYTEQDGAKISFPDPENGEAYTVTDGVAHFTLHHDQSLVFDDIPLGAYVVVTEAESDYEITVSWTERIETTGDNGAKGTELKTLTGTNIASFVTTLDPSDSAEDNAVTFTNDKEVTIDTGIALDSMPYVLLLVGIAAIGLILFGRKRKTEY